MIASRVTTARHWWERPPATARGHRVYAVGDVHGRYDLFDIMIRELERHNAEIDDGKKVTLVVLGDVIDRGPQSRRLIRLLMSVQGRSDRLVVLLGNHEAALLAAIGGDPDAQEGWLRFGGLATLASFDIEAPRDGEGPLAFGERLAAGLGPEVVAWLEALPLSINCGDYFFCHAGVRPGVRLHRQRRTDLLWIREPFLSSRRNFGAVVVHGHTIMDEVRFAPNRISIDTGAYESGVLSAVCLDGSDQWVFATDPDREEHEGWPIIRPRDEERDLFGS